MSKPLTCPCPHHIYISTGCLINYFFFNTNDLFFTRNRDRIFKRKKYSLQKKSEFSLFFIWKRNKDWHGIRPIRHMTRLFNGLVMQSFQRAFQPVPLKMNLYRNDLIKNWEFSFYQYFTYKSGKNDLTDKARHAPACVAGIRTYHAYHKKTSRHRKKPRFFPL